MNQVLLIGGEYNGQRVDNPGGGTVVMKRLIPSNISDEALLYYKMALKEDHYKLAHLGHSVLIGVHDSIDLEKALNLLCKKYPKKKRRLSEEERTQKYWERAVAKAKNQWLFQFGPASPISITHTITPPLCPSNVGQLTIAP